METLYGKNNVTLSGRIATNFDFSHESFGEKFYTALIASKRTSGIDDMIPVMVSNRIIDIATDWTDKFVEVSGQFRSYNNTEKKEGKSRLVLYVFVTVFETAHENEDPIYIQEKDKIFLDGYICKKPIYRKTPLGREIADVLFAVNRQYGKSDYIPCVVWGRNALYVSELEVGTRLQIEGRIQSREYQKQISEGEYETRTAYEVSVSKLTAIEEKE